jgi:hypothetical protein
MERGRSHINEGSPNARQEELVNRGDFWITERGDESVIA